MRHSRAATASVVVVALWLACAAVASAQSNNLSTKEWQTLKACFDTSAKFTLCPTGGPPSSAPAPPDTSVQFDNGGMFGGDASMLWNNTTKQIVFGNNVNFTPILFTGFDGAFADGGFAWIQVKSHGDLAGHGAGNIENAFGIANTGTGQSPGQGRSFSFAPGTATVDNRQFGAITHYGSSWWKLLPDIIAVNQGTKTFTLDSIITPGATLTVAGSTGNDGVYTVASSSGYTITVVQVIPSAFADGHVTTPGHRDMSVAAETVLVKANGTFPVTQDQDTEFWWEWEGPGIFGGATGGLLRLRWDGLPTTNLSLMTHSNPGSIIRFQTAKLGGGGSHGEIANMVDEVWTFTPSNTVFDASGLTMGTAGSKILSLVNNSLLKVTGDNQEQITIINTTDANGANLKFVSSGAKPNMSIRVHNGRMEWLGNPYTDILASLDQNGTFTLTDPGTFSAMLILDGSADAAFGANMLFKGDGGTTPNKFLRVTGGQFQIMNSGYTGSLLTIRESNVLDQGVSTVFGSGVTASAVLGTTGTVFGNNITNGVALGGTLGGIQTGVTNGVSLNGGVVTTSNMTAIGGTRLDVAYLASASNCIKTNASGTLSTGSCGITGSGSSPQITVWNGSSSVTGFADFTWDDSTANFLASVSPSGFTGTLTKSAIIGGTNNSINTASANGADRSIILGGAVNEIDQVSTSSTDSAIIGSTSSTITDSEVSGIYSSTASSINGTGGTSSAIAIAGSGSITVSATGANTTSFSGSLGSGSGSITNSTKSVLLGSTSGSASGCDSCAVLGGTGGVASATNAVSINGGSATVNNTTAIGGATVAFSGNTTHGQTTNVKALTEETTIAAAATTDTSIQAPANALVLGVSVRVTTVIPTAATFDVGVAGATTRYGTGISTAATTTFASSGTTNPTIYGSATSIRITPNLSPAAATGKLRVTIFYVDLTPPTS